MIEGCEGESRTVPRYSSIFRSQREHPADGEHLFAAALFLQLAHTSQLLPDAELGFHLVLPTDFPTTLQLSEKNALSGVVRFG